MVRQAEFFAVNLDKDLVGAFDELVSYWQQNVTPLIDELRNEFLGNQKLIDLSSN